jgi:hypothetical protein
LSNIYAQCPQVQVSEVGDRVVLFHRDRQTTTILNPTGSRIWGLLSTPSSESALAERLAASHHDLSYDRALVDVTAFMASLVDQGLVILDD